VGIIGREEHADIARHARENHASDAQGFEQRIQGGVEESRMLGFSAK
jgi:hypothetical protein